MRIIKNIWLININKIERKASNTRNYGTLNIRTNYANIRKHLKINIEEIDRIVFEETMKAKP